MKIIQSVNQQPPRLTLSAAEGCVLKIKSAPVCVTGVTVSGGFTLDDAAALFEEVAADDAAALLAASGGEWKLRQQQQLLTAAGVTVSVEPEPAADAQEWRAGELALAGQTRRFGEQVWRAVQAHLTQTGWEPPAVPALWTPVSDSGGAPAWTQPTGAHDAYALGALVTHGGAAWQSLVANNVWEPTAANATLWQRQS